MPRDYVKKRKGNKKSGASRGKNNNKPSFGLVFSALLLISGLITLLVYLKWYQPAPAPIKEKESVIEKKQPTKIISQKEQTKNTDTEEVPFYKTHEEMVNKTVEIPLEDLKLPDEKYQYEYLMPCGSFRDKKRAEELKAQIALAGYESKINQVKADSSLWHRVELGPYKSKRKTESIRHRLQDNGFNYCKIWPKRKIN